MSVIRFDITITFTIIECPGWLAVPVSHGEIGSLLGLGWGIQTCLVLQTGLLYFEEEESANKPLYIHTYHISNYQDGFLIPNFSVHLLTSPLHPPPPKQTYIHT